MSKKKIPVMSADDPRQFMLNDNIEMYEKTGVPSGALEMHFHNFYEIMYILEGEFTVLVNNTTYVLHTGDFILIDVNQLHHYCHTAKKRVNTRRILMWVTKSYLNQLSGTDLNLNECFSYTPAWRFPPNHREKLHDYLMQLLYLNTENCRNITEYKLLQNAYTTLFFVYLNRLCTGKEFTITNENTYSNPMIRIVSDYINSHLSESITVDTLASQVHLSKYHFSRIFKDTTGMTIKDFIVQKRLIAACEMIWAGKPLKNIYRLCGFSDYSSFFRNFKSFYGFTPSEYKSLYSKEPVRL